MGCFSLIRQQDVSLVVALIVVMIGTLFFARIHDSIGDQRMPSIMKDGGCRGYPLEDPAHGRHEDDFRNKFPSWVNMDNGIVSYGNTDRMRIFKKKLQAGEPVTVGVVGGSISWGQGSSDRFKTSWVERFFDWIRTTFPHANHTLVNGAVPATPSAYMALCWRYYVPPNPDLMIVEYNVNDGGDKSMNAPIRRAHERLLRSLLSLKSRPAVIQNVVMRIPEDNIPAPRYRNAGGDDELGVLAQYYHLPWISTRSLMWDTMNHIEESQRVNYTEWMADRDHPNDLGHGLVAGMLIHLVETTPPYIFKKDLGSRGTHLPLPLYPNNFQVFNNTCILNEQFEKHVVASQGFQWANDGTDSKPKYGFIGTQVGSHFQFAINTAENIVNSPDGGTSSVSIAYLASYEHMGVFRVSCPTPSCACDPIVIDGHKEEHTSQLFTASMKVTKNESCILDFRIENITQSKEHKVRITGVIVSPDALDPSANMYFAVENHLFDPIHHDTIKVYP